MKKFFKYSWMLVLPAVVAAAIIWNTSASDQRCPAVDPQDHTVLLPNPENCSTFFSCSNGVPILMHCPDGLCFNDELDVCDWCQQTKCNPCPDPYDVPGMYISAKVAGSGTITSDGKGNLTINGVLTAGFEKNKEYPVTVMEKNCSEPKDGACCRQSDVGVYHVM